MRSRIQTELKILKSLNKNQSIRLLIHQFETFLLNEDDDELKLKVKQFHRDCFILFKGLEVFDKKDKLTLEDKKIQSDAFYLHSQLNFLL